MTENGNFRDRIHVARIVGIGEGYAMHHRTDQGLMPHEVIDYGTGSERLEGYVDGLTINNGPGVDVFNGIPEDVRKGWFPRMRLERLSKKEWGGLLSDHSRFGERLASGKIRLIP